MLAESFVVDSDRCKVTDDHITTTYEYASTSVQPEGNQWVVRPTTTTYEFQVDRRVPKLG